MTLMKRSQNYYPSLPSFFDRFFEGDLMDWNNWNFSGSNMTLPAVNVKETDDEFQIELAAPGMKKDDFRINYENGRLTISSELQEDRNEKKENYSRREFTYNSFQRSFTVPENLVSGEKISAGYKEGILHVNIPKKEEVKPKPAREIKIS